MFLKGHNNPGIPSKRRWISFILFYRDALHILLKGSDNSSFKTNNEIKSLASSPVHGASLAFRMRLLQVHWKTHEHIAGKSPSSALGSFVPILQEVHELNHNPQRTQ